MLKVLMKGWLTQDWQYWKMKKGLLLLREIGMVEKVAVVEDAVGRLVPEAKQQ